MMKKAFFHFTPNVIPSLLAACLLMLIGCAATQVTATWKDPAYQGGRPNNVLIIGVSRLPTARRAFESELARHFKARGTNAHESFRLLPEDALEGKDAQELVVAKIQEQGIDAVLMSRTAGTRTEKDYMPAPTLYSAPYRSYGAWGAYYGAGSSYPASASSVAGYTHERTYRSLETHLYDVKTQKLIWSMRTETLIAGAPEKEIKPVVDIIIKKLFNDKLFQ